MELRFRGKRIKRDYEVSVEMADVLDAFDTADILSHLATSDTFADELIEWLRYHAVDGLVPLIARLQEEL